jgi:hypothetical protein
MHAIAMYRHRISRSLRGCTLQPSLRLSLFEDGFCLNLFGFLIALPFLDRWAREPREVVESWGVYYDDGHSVVWCWGDYCKFFYMPWQFTHIGWQVRRPDGTWAKRVASYDRGEPDGREVFVLPYRYTLRSGEVQERTATIHVERGEWRRKFLKWCPWFAMVRTSIDITFSDEVGEHTGSWKGGCIGTGYDMKPGETAEQCLRRMESERKF